MRVRISRVYEVEVPDSAFGKWNGEDVYEEIAIKYALEEIHVDGERLMIINSQVIQFIED